MPTSTRCARSTCHSRQRAQAKAHGWPRSRAAASGHWYFSLNDGDAQIKCVCWKGTNYRVRFKPKDGVTVRIRGRLTFWESKGEVKLNVESLEPSGEGALAAAYEQIRAKLEA